ncbi:MAG: hypothetical protein Athens101410_112 [Parcubacteria group bacterium Athens1014_10]|nr:MAG: hypothetical protein Athens101410_112 [Parcubacteria group bacterium Athens1014_10]TSD05919.1 MAG: hypothetical protein Athens071412_201 [Parcubacteria group bacterium Athens0714_12]
MPENIIKKKSLPSTQKYLDIAEIKDDCVVLKDGSLRTILLVSSINFALKSEEEQKAIIQGYVNFLNSLEFSVQIIVQSRKLNISSYIEKLKEVEENQENDLLKMQTAEYISYIQELVEMGEIMSKYFYVAVSYSPFSGGAKNFFIRLQETLSAVMIIKLKRTLFEKYKLELFKRADTIMSGLASMGLKSVPLDTQSLIELFYKTYNPEIAEQEKLESLEKLRIDQ